VTRGFLCAKVTRYLKREYSPDRLLHPLRRTGRKGEGRFERISWDDAIRLIARRFREISTQYGPEAIVPYSYAGTMGLLNGAGMDRRFFHHLGASRLDRTICSAAGTQALERTLGHRYGTEPEQFRHSRLILAWGANILECNAHLWPFLTEARRNGAKFYSIDPVCNRTTAAADRHFALLPGSDQALALGLMHVILAENLQDFGYIASYTSGFNELAELVRRYPPERTAALTGIPAGDIVALAREYATTRPAVIRLNYGVQRSERGGAAVHAISLLPALTGSWREIGGGLLLTTSGGFRLNYEGLERPDLQLRSPLGGEARLLNMVRIGEVLAETDNPPVKALVVYNSNPAATAPNQKRVHEGLRRKDLFTVVLEQFQTDTADYADVVLPVTTFLEHTDLYFSYGHYYVQLARPALPRPGEVKSNVEIFRLLAGAMGFEDSCFGDSEDDMIRTALDSRHPFLSGITLEKLEKEHFMRLRVSPPGEPFLPFADGRFGTASGKCEFGAAELEYTPPAESRYGDASLRRRFPLEFVTPKSGEGMNATFGNQPEAGRRCAILSIHAEDAAARDIATGDPVRVFNDRGGCLFHAEVAEAGQPGVVSARSAQWPKLAPGGVNSNAVTSDRLADLAGGAVYYSCLVQVEKCEEPQ